MRDPDKIYSEFRSAKVMTIKQLSVLFGISERNTHRHLKKKGVLSSYNKNGAYYTLPDVPVFDGQNGGIWQFEGICFSRYGNLARTLVHVVANAGSGLTSCEIGKLLHLDPRSFLNHFKDHDEIRREKIDGHFVYFSADENICGRQRSSRMKEAEKCNAQFDSLYVSALAERIKRPDIPLPRLVPQLQRGKASVSSLVAEFFSRNVPDSAFSRVRLLRDLLDRNGNNLSPSFLFGGKPDILFDAGLEAGQCCGRSPKQLKTREKTVYTMHIGGFVAQEKIVKCGLCGRIYHSAELLEIVPPGCVYGYDVMIHIGESMFFGHRQAAEIQMDLRKRNVPVSVSEVEYLAGKFIIYLAIAHERNNTGIVEVMDSNGGYILHIDALGDKGGPRLISGIDSISDFVLGNAKIKSEHSDHVIPFLRKIKKQFGTPLAVVQDMGKGIMTAVEAVFPKIKILICHFHFLRDIGKDLLEDNYDIIRKRSRHFGFLVKLRDFSKELKLLFDGGQKGIDKFHEARSRNRKINLDDNTEAAIHLYTIIEWILDWKNESNGYGFPFDRPHFDLVSRVESALKVLDTVKDAGGKTKIPVVKIRRRLKVLLSEITEDRELKNAMSKMGNEIQVFDALRNAMRVAPKNGGNGLNDGGECVDIKTIEASVDKFRVELGKNPEFLKERKGAAFLKQIDKYRKQLFADPITVKTAVGKKTIQPQRTNNLMERMFRDFTRDNKRKTGVDSTGRTIQAMIDDTPLVRNLKNNNYRKIIIGDKKNLAEVFSEINIDTVRKKMKEHNLCNEKVPRKIQSLLKEGKLLDMLSNIEEKFRLSEKI